MRIKKLYTTNRLGIDDSDIIARPHGMRYPEDDIAEELRRLTKVIVRSKNKRSKDDIQTADTSAGVKNLDSKKPSKREMKQKLSVLRKTIKLGKKEAELLKILSDFQPQKAKNLTTQVPTKAYKKLKESLSKKLKGTGFNIKTNGGYGLTIGSFYQLEYLPPMGK